MPILFTKRISSIFTKNVQEDQTLAEVSPDKSKPSFKDLFVRRNKAKVEDEKSISTSSLMVKNTPTAMPTRTSIIVDALVVEALQSVFDALHDPSLLDAGRHQRYDLYTTYIPPETPEPHEVTRMPNSPRCGRIAVVGTSDSTTIREISTTENCNDTKLVRMSDAMPLPSSPAADIEASRPASERDVVEIIHIPTPHCDRSGIEESRNIAIDISTDEIHSAAPVRASTPLLRISCSTVDAVMDVAGVNMIPFPSRDSSSPSPAFSGGPRVMDATNMKVLRFLGEGTTGKVYFVKDNISKAKVALKVITKESKNEYTLNTIVQEFEISEKLADSPWFITLYASWHDHDHMYIAMTLYPTDLDSELMRLDRIEPDRARFYMAEIIIALAELHSRGIIHRDVKAPNILIDREGHIVLADFGLSKDFGQIPTIAERVYQPYWPYLPHDNPTCETEPREPAELVFVAWDYRGSELEMAPEIHLRQPYSFGVDFWSAAVVLYWMLTGRPPWYEQEEEESDEENGYEVDLKPLTAKIAEDDLPWLPSDDHVDDEARDFLEKMLAKDPKKRLLISYEMPNHPYFAGVNWPLLESRKTPAPWIPEFEICHAYEQTSPTFVPGRPYSEDEEDPYPSFTYLSKQARRRIVYEECDSSDESDSDYGSESRLTQIVDGIEDESQYIDTTFIETLLNKRRTPDKHSVSADLTLLDAPIGERDPSTSQNDSTLRVDSLDKDTPVQQMHEHSISDSRNTSVLPVKSIQEGSILQDSWDLTLISPPSMAPYSPGPKGWLYAHDLLRICPKQSATIASSTTSASSVEIMYVTLKGSQDSALDGMSLDDRSSAFTHLAQCDTTDSWPSPVGRQATHVVNGTGLLFKVKAWWMSKAWTPKPKRNLGVKGRSC